MREDSNTKKYSDKNSSELYELLLDVIFGMIIATSWNNNKAILFDPNTFKFEAFTLLLVYVTVVAGWIGYHFIIKKRPDINPYIFFIDLVILFLYWYLVNSVGFFSIIIMLLPMIFVFILLWDIVYDISLYKSVTRPRTDPQSHLKVMRGWIASHWIRIIFLALFIVQALIYFNIENDFKSNLLYGRPIIDWATCSTSLIMVIAYSKDVRRGI